MNKLIKEFIKQCSTTFDSYDFEYGWSTHEYFDKEKFAELIIKECMKLNHEHFSDEDPYSIDSLYRYHFGVKE
jgi:hypothetical protein